MKRIIEFHKVYIPTVLVSTAIILSGIVGYVVNGGFNLGVDFQAGLVQEVTIAPTALQLSYTGKGNASFSMDSSKLSIVVSGADVENKTYSFPFAETQTVDVLVAGLAKVPGIAVAGAAPGSTSTLTLLQSAHENPKLGAAPYGVHYLLPNAEPIAIDKVRAAAEKVGSVSVQKLGKDSDRHFLVRVEDKGKEAGFSKKTTEALNKAIGDAFGADNLVVTRTDFVGARFSKNLTDQAGLLVVLTLLVILAYCWVRFKRQFAIGAVLSVVHDAMIMVAFIAWTRMEFNTSTIAAILTVLGYSINDTIVNYDRIRENTRLFPDQSMRYIIDRSVSETLGRTIITTLTVIIAAFSLFYFTTGSMKDFSLALLVGVSSGVYSTIYIASAFVYWWDWRLQKKNKKDVAAAYAASDSRKA